MQIESVDEIYDRMGFIGENKLKYVKKKVSEFKIEGKIIEHSPFLIIIEDCMKMD